MLVQVIHREITRFMAQDLHCKKYANSGLRARPLVPPNAAEPQWPEVADPFELGGLCDDNLEETQPAITEVEELQVLCGNKVILSCIVSHRGPVIYPFPTSL